MTISDPASQQVALGEIDAEANRQLTTLEGWRKSIEDPPAPPVLLSAGELKRLSETERDLDDEYRLDHHARMLVVATSFVEKTVVCGRRLVLLNRHANQRPPRPDGLRASRNGQDQRHHPARARP